MKFIKVAAISLIAIFILQKPLFFMLDAIYEPHTEDVIASEKLKSEKGQDTLKKLKTYKSQSDKYSAKFYEDVHSNGFARRHQTEYADKYNRLMKKVNDKYHIDQNTDLPKRIEYVNMNDKHH